MAESRRVIFPIIPDDTILEKDNRVILTNEQLLTNNPSAQLERSFSDAPKATGLAANRGYQRPYKPTVSYSSQHRPLNSNHSGVSSFDKMPKKTSVDESRERIKRAAAVPPKCPKGYVHPLDREKDAVTSSATSGVRKSPSPGLNQRPLGRTTNTKPGRNNNPIQDMKRQGMSVADAQKHHDSSDDYFKSKRDSLFDRGSL